MELEARLVYPKLTVTSSALCSVTVHKRVVGVPTKGVLSVSSLWKENEEAGETI